MSGSVQLQVSARPTALLPKNELFRFVGVGAPSQDRINLAHLRARAVVLAYSKIMVPECE